MLNEFNLKPHHCGISVPDIEASVAWYRDVLGFTVAHRTGMGEGKIVFMKLGDFYIELFEMPGSKPSADMDTPMGQDLTVQGTKHIAFVVEDLEKFSDYLKSRGVAMPAMGRPPPKGAGGPHGNNAPPPEDSQRRALFIRDNSGVMLEFVPPTAPE
jgi:methylmalonyl-CoA/ethylmalonyl-CoA epimerase